MDAIEVARDLGQAIQKDERFVRMMLAQGKNDKDEPLQRMIVSFNTLRNQLNAEVQKKEKDADAIQDMDSDLKELYQAIFDNENMKEYSAAREEFKEMMDFINQIISGSANGENPHTIEREVDCGGNCGGCAGCH